MEIGLKEALGLATVALLGWNMYIQREVKSLNKLWAWKDEFSDKYNEDRLQDAREYVSKRELAKAIEHIDSKIERIDEKLDKLLLRGS